MAIGPEPFPPTPAASAPALPPAAAQPRVTERGWPGVRGILQRHALEAPLLLWLALAVLTRLPYVAAQQAPPTGARFTGIFFYRDDFYQYMSFAEQAARGAFVFQNKFNIEPHQALIVNLEWWAIGALGALFGGRLEAAFHVVWLVALACFVFTAWRLLGMAGLREGRRTWGLLLVTTGGGLGWLRLWQGRPGSHIPDLLMSMYPWHQSLLSGHVLVGTALFLLAVLFYLEARAGLRNRSWWIAAAWCLGLCRPYDLLVFVLLALGLAARDVAGGRPAVRSVVDLAWLAPIFFYYGLLLSPGSPFRGWDGVQSGDLNPPTFEFVFALLPALGFWLAFRRRGDPGAPARELRAGLLLWAGILALIIASYRAPLMKTFVTSAGVVVLLLAASVTPRRWLPVAVLTLSPTSLFLLWRVFHPLPDWFSPRDYFTAVEHLRAACAPQEVALAPTDLSLMIGGLTPCAVSVGHRGLTPGYPARVAEGTHFYDPRTPPEWRLGYLRTTRARFVLLPRGVGFWLGGDRSWSTRLALPLLEIWETADAVGPEHPPPAAPTLRSEGLHP